MSRCCSENWKRKGRRRREGMERRGTVRRQRPRCLRPDSTLYIRPPPIHPRAPNPIPARQGNFLHPHHPPIIHLSRYSSLFQPTNGNNNTQQPTVRRSSFSPASHPSAAPRHDGSFDQTTRVGPDGGKEILLNHAKNVTGRFFGVV